MYNQFMLDHSRSNSDELIEEIKRSQDKELDAFLERAWLVRAERSRPHLDAAQTNLLHQINATLPRDQQEQIAVLNQKMLDKQLTEPEHLELIALSQEAEKVQARRLEAVLELSKIRGVTPKQMLKKLGIAA